MDVKVKAKSSFTHGRFNFSKGQTGSMPETMAKDLEKAGLVELAAAAINAPIQKPARQPAAKPTPKSGKAAAASAPAPAPAADPEQTALVTGEDTAAGTPSADVCNPESTDTEQNDKGA